MSSARDDILGRLRPFLRDQIAGFRFVQVAAEMSAQTGTAFRLAHQVLEGLGSLGLKGSVAGMGEDMHDALTLLAHGRFQTGAFTGASFPLDRIQEAFESLSSRPADLKTQILLA